MKKSIYLLVVVLFLGGLTACNSSKRLAKQRHTYMEQAFVEIKDSLSEAQVTILNDTIKVLFPENLLFSVGQSQILPGVPQLMQRFSNALNKFNRTSVLVNGYTDNTGTEKINEKLSRERAENVSKLLINNQVDSARVFAWGRGNKNPIASNDTENGRRLNRRVEFVILYKVKNM